MRARNEKRNEKSIALGFFPFERNIKKWWRKAKTRKRRKFSFFPPIALDPFKGKMAKEAD